MARTLTWLAPLLVLFVVAAHQPVSAEIKVPELPRTDDAATTEPAAPDTAEADPAEPDAAEPAEATPTPPPPPNANQPPPPPNAPGQQTEKAEWFVSPSGSALGPFTVSQLIQMATDKKITGSTPVWKDGMAAWALLKDLPELSQVAAAVPKADTPTPPPPENTQALLDKKMKDFLLGTWRYQGSASSGGYSYFVVVEATYRTDGTYAGSMTMQMPAQGGYQPPPFINPLSGTYEIVAIDDSNFVLSLFDRNGENSKSSLRIVDRNTLVNTSDPSKRSYRIR